MSVDLCTNHLLRMAESFLQFLLDLCLAFAINQANACLPDKMMEVSIKL